MTKRSISHRVYSKEFKDEAIALAQNRDKPISGIAVDLGIHENLLYRWMRKSRESMETGLKAFPGRGRPRDEELAKLRKENKALKEANEILKKAAVIFANETPR